MWPTWAGLRAWVARHRTKLIIAGILLGTGLYLYRRWRSALDAFGEFQRKLALFAETEAFYSRDQATALTAVISSQTIAKLVEVPKAEQMRTAMASTSAQEKMNMWNKVKEKSFLQAYSSLFAFTIFALFQRVQLTLLSRDNCLVSRASSTALATPTKSSWGGLLSRSTTPKAADFTQLTDEDKQSYLLQCNYFLATGVPRLVALLEEHLKALLANLSLQQTFTPSAVRDLFLSLSTQLMQDIGAPSSFLYDLSVPPPAAPTALATLTATTKTALQSPAFVSLYREQILRVSNLLSAKLSESIPANAPLPFAKLLLPLSKVSEVLLPVDAAAARAVAEQFHNVQAAEEYIRKLFGLFEEVDTTSLKGVI